MALNSVSSKAPIGSDKMGIAIYADGAEISKLEEYASSPVIEGFTTNPSLMRKAGIKDYRTFAKTVLSLVKGKPVSFEVVSDEWDEMERQAKEIQSWGDNVFVKIPITNTKGESSYKLIKTCAELNLNVTAVMTRAQILEVEHWMRPHHILSVFVGRITDTQRPILAPDSTTKKFRWLWASTREVYSIKRAAICGFDVITMTPDLLAKLTLEGKELNQYSLETVRQFYEDGKGLTI